MKRPIFLRLTGGLGNQLFQLSAAINFARISGREVRLDTSLYSRKIRKDPRPLDLAPGGLPIEFVKLNPWAARFMARLPEPLCTRESPKGIGNLRRGTLYVIGYFQSLQGATEALDLTSPYLKKELSGFVPEEQNYVAVHCRLGDYLNSATRAFHGATDPRWSIREGRQLANELKIPNIRVFTDSPAILKRILRNEIADTFQVDQFQGPWEVLGSMSGAAGLVISNSSLSWWAAFISSRVLGLSTPVVMPYPWLSQPSHLDSDLKDPTWRIGLREML